MKRGITLIIVCVATSIVEAIADQITGHAWPSGILGVVARLPYLATGALIFHVFTRR